MSDLQRPGSPFTDLPEDLRSIAEEIAAAPQVNDRAGLGGAAIAEVLWRLQNVGYRIEGAGKSSAAGWTDAEGIARSLEGVRERTEQILRTGEGELRPDALVGRQALERAGVQEYGNRIG